MISKRIVDLMMSKILRLYVQAAKELVFKSVAAGADATEEKQFNFRDYPGLQKKADDIIKKLAADTTDIILSGEERAWLLSSQANVKLLHDLFGKELPKVVSERFVGRNIEGLRAFQKRKVKGLGLSRRIWNYTKTFEADAKLILDNGILAGQSAAKMADALARHVVKPNVAFDEFRNNRGVIELSKEAEHYHPGQGHYRSSLKNAERVARTEINNAYREADTQAWHSMDFVVGYEVRRSNNPYPCPRCEALKGRYPKTFKFYGWHPQCRCAMIPILATDDEFDEINDMLSDGEDVSGYKSENGVYRLSPDFLNYVKKNKKQVSAAWWYEANEDLIKSSRRTQAE